MIIRLLIMDISNGDEAILQYDNDPSKRFIVWGLFEGPDRLRKKLQKYFTTDITVKIPLTGAIDDYDEVTDKPINNIDHFQLSLNMMNHKIKVRLEELLNVEPEDV